MATIMKQLGDMFSLKDMGSLHFFLGIEVIPTRAGLFLSQHKYVHELLAHTSMSSAKDVSIPLSTTQSLQLVDGIVAVDNSEFCKIIGSLQYLSLTHPDISFAVKKTLAIYAQADYKSLDRNQTTHSILKTNHFFMVFKSTKLELQY